MKLIIQDDEGHKTIVPLLRDEITIGRNDENLVRLNEKDVSRKHGRIVREGDRFTIEDLGSFTGIRVNGERIRGKREVSAGDHIQISEYEMTLDAGADEAANDARSEDAASILTEAVSALEPPLAFVSGEPKLDGPPTVRLSDLKPGAIIETPVQDVPERRRPKLIGISGTHRGKELALHKTPLRIGRSEDNDLPIDHPSIAPRHLRLRLDGEAWTMDAEPRAAVRVNGEPSAQIALRHGDVLELGHLRFAFVEAGRPFKLPNEFAPVPAPVGPVAAGNAPSARSFAIAVSVLAIAAAGVYLWKIQVGDPGAEARAERRFALRSADEAASAHRYSEALRDVDIARRAGASDDELASYEPLESEARSEETYREMESAAASQDWEQARKLLASLTSTKTYFGTKAAEKAEAITSGYVNLHLASAALMKGKDNAGCLAEAQMALAANPRSGEARALIDACKAPSSPAVTAARKASHNPRPSVLAAVTHGDDGAARALIDEGNQKLTAPDVEAALALFRKALSLRPTGSVLAGAYRGLGIAYTRSGNSEEGARYYRLYLPLCTDAEERAQLQRVLADYDARGR